ncbi:tRNA lysidine(34) synthetase TilS [Thalassotalea sp. LPB0316]|uniref:tRNA lysidine(34) synthetase TilS n=1 Tax=Thalassotalea sp. LPB0316 TaxID=2769490 RepID=UPI0018686983|nr:tRNA lysidine(34) synthetase TilS [Thalassotalea sp. LPB0316]QOL24610.1 tRNA lysidine(34) synthetase TilS [Thalassotalea sp. LPB0316]
MQFIEQAIIAAIELAQRQDRVRPIYIAHSGGVDSQVLLYACAKLKNKGLIKQPLVACHIHHGLSQFADDWQRFCQNQASKLSVDFITENVELSINPQQSTEAVAREARYLAFQRLMPAHGLMLTGHHLDDQAETMLLALKRGAGVAGLACMNASTVLFHRQVIRPMLSVTREQIEHYAAEHDIEHIEDDSNVDEQFDRNFIRHQIMPLLQARWPSIGKTIARTAQNCQQSQVLLEQIAQEDLTKARTSNNSLNLAQLNQLTSERLNNLLRYVLMQEYAVTPSVAQLTEIKQQMVAANDKTPAVNISGITVRRFQQALYFTPEFNDVNQWLWQVNAPIIEGTQIDLPDGIGQLQFDGDDHGSMLAYQLRAPEPGQQVSVRFSHNNPTCLPEYRNHSKALKKILQELKIAPWLRKRIPFIYYDDELVAALGHFVCKDFTPTPSSTNFTLYYSFEQDSR